MYMNEIKIILIGCTVSNIEERLLFKQQSEIIIKKFIMLTFPTFYFSFWVQGIFFSILLLLLDSPDFVSYSIK